MAQFKLPHIQGNFLWANHGRATAWLSVALAWLLTMQLANVAAQDDQAEAKPAKPGIVLGPVSESEWEFGVAVESKGAATGISVSAPIPKTWPEQDVEILEEIKSDNVVQMRRRSQTKWAEKLDYRVSRLGPGETAEGYIKYRVRKKMVIAPTETDQYTIAKKVPSQIRSFLKPSPYIESKAPQIESIAKELWDESLNGWDQVEKNFRWVRDNVEYKFDPMIRTCLEALKKEQGDCEELSSIFIAICRAQGIPARAVWIPAHTYPEFYLVDKNGKGHWFPCQAAGNYEFGSMTEVKPILHKGDRFKIPGSRTEVRYLQPTLTAKNASAPLQLKWIQREANAGESK